MEVPLPPKRQPSFTASGLLGQAALAARSNRARLVQALRTQTLRVKIRTAKAKDRSIEAQGLGPGFGPRVWAQGLGP
jgi:hypothetical protein